MSAHVVPDFTVCWLLGLLITLIDVSLSVVNFARMLGNVRVRCLIAVIALVVYAVARVL